MLGTLNSFRMFWINRHFPDERGRLDRKMRWPQWYPTRADVVGILFALVLICISAFVLMRFPSVHQATGFDPDWDCKSVPNGEPVCMKKPGR
jgi:hypothetical protein